jgi:hypothetical protein
MRPCKDWRFVNPWPVTERPTAPGSREGAVFVQRRGDSLIQRAARIQRQVQLGDADQRRNTRRRCRDQVTVEQVPLRRGVGSRQHRHHLVGVRYDGLLELMPSGYRGGRAARQLVAARQHFDDHPAAVPGIHEAHRVADGDRVGAVNLDDCLHHRPE